jgi:hypothetical protein
MVRRVADWYQYTGCVHIHTTESDGTKSLEEVVALGREVGLEFMMFSDHMNLNNREAGKEGFYGKTLVVVGYEHNDQNDHHHYLLFGSPRAYPKEMTAAEYVAAGAKDGALGILAHPDEVRNALKMHPPYPWDDWSVEDFDGIELWNQMSEWTEKLTRWNYLAMAFSPRKSIVAPTDRILAKWDELNMTRKYVGLAGADAHAFSIRIWPFRFEIFPYKVHFKSLRCYILLPEKMSEDPDDAKRQVYDAIRDCRLFFANERWGSAEKFEFTGESGATRVCSGGRLESGAEAVLTVKLPEPATLRLVHNGQRIVETSADKLEYRVEADGIYRAEAWKGRRGWIFSNHIRVGC